MIRLETINQATNDKMKRLKFHACKMAHHPRLKEQLAKKYGLTPEQYKACYRAFNAADEALQFSKSPAEAEIDDIVKSPVKVEINENKAEFLQYLKLNEQSVSFTDEELAELFLSFVPSEATK